MLQSVRALMRPSTRPALRRLMCTAETPPSEDAAEEEVDDTEAVAAAAEAERAAEYAAQMKVFHAERREFKAEMTRVRKIYTEETAGDRRRRKPRRGIKARDNGRLPPMKETVVVCDRPMKPKYERAQDDAAIDRSKAFAQEAIAEQLAKTGNWIDVDDLDSRLREDLFNLSLPEVGFRSTLNALRMGWALTLFEY